MTNYILSIDQGTTSTRAFVWDQNLNVIAKAQKVFEQYYPKPGWVEHDADTIWHDTVSVCRDAMFKAGIAPERFAGIGITNQRETTVLWDQQTGKPIHRAIVWQDRRSSDLCHKLRQQNLEPIIQQKTGLLLDPYFSAVKLKWLLDNVPDARQLAEQGRLAFGTIDCYLLWRLTAGKSHMTDITNAARTALFNIHSCNWDQQLLEIFDIPAAVLPKVADNNAHFGTTPAHLLGAPIAVTGMIGDQQAAAVGQACLQEGMMKSTYGTGAFMLLNTGNKAISSQNRLLTTIAYRFDQRISYALEGGVFIAGAAMQWLKDNVHMLKHASESQALAESVADSGGVYMIPAFTGLGAPYWQPDVRGAILGITRDTNIAHITRATLEAVAYQTRDLLQAITNDGAHCSQLRVDGGMATNDWLCQNMADTLQIPTVRPTRIETTVLGAAFVAGLRAGLWNLDQCSSFYHPDQSFSPQESKTHANERYLGWQQAVNMLIGQQQ